MVHEDVIAYHEAGHALVAEAVGGRVLRVTIVPMEDDGPRRHGETTIAWRQDGINAEQLAWQQAQAALAGPVAEIIYRDLQHQVEVIQEWWADWLVAIDAVQRLRTVHSPDDARRTLQTLTGELAAWLRQAAVWERLARLADQLQAHETLEEDLLDELRDWRVL